MTRVCQFRGARASLLSTNLIPGSWRLPSCTALARCSIRMSTSTAPSSKASSRRTLRSGDVSLKQCLRPAVARRCVDQGPPAFATPAAPLKLADVEVMAKDLRGPRGLLFLPSADLLVVEQSNGSIAKVARDGQTRRIASGLLSPHVIDVDPQGNLYVAETGSDRVALVSPGRKVSTCVGVLDSPVDFAFNPAGELLVCKLSSGRVLAFKSPTTRCLFASGLRGPRAPVFDLGAALLSHGFPTITQRI